MRSARPPRRAPRLQRASVAAAIALASPVAVAVDRTTYPYPGVVHVHRVLPGLDAHVVTVDLASGHADVVATRPRDRWSRVSMFAREYDAQIAINANFYGNGSCGIAMGERRFWRDSYVEQCDASMAFGWDGGRLRAEIWDSEGAPDTIPFAWATHVVSGMPILLQRGHTFFDPHEPNGMYRFHPRTAIGTSADHATLLLAVIDGRRAGLPGVMSNEMIPLLEEFGASDAMNLDGGGSSELWIAAEGGVVNIPSDGHERTVMNHFGVRITTSGPPAR